MGFNLGSGMEISSEMHEALTGSKGLRGSPRLNRQNHAEIGSIIEFNPRNKMKIIQHRVQTYRVPKILVAMLCHDFKAFPESICNHTDTVPLFAHLISSDLDSESAKAEGEIHPENSADQDNLHSALVFAASAAHTARPERWDEPPV